MEIIKKLQPEDQQLIPTYWAKWEAAALSTEPIDHKDIKSAVQELYLEMGLSPPRDFIFYQSPDCPFSIEVIILKLLAPFGEVYAYVNHCPNFSGAVGVTNRRGTARIT